jgi:hypothetical protein
VDWQVHWLEAEGDLAPWRERIAAEIEVARTAVAGVLPPFRLDILVERVTGAVIPEVGTTGRAYRPSLCGLTVDPLNPNFAASLDTGDIRRTIAHEVHHCRRFAGPGYGRTLGEAIVSEGLAGQFAGTLFKAPPRALGMRPGRHGPADPSPECGGAPGAQSRSRRLVLRSRRPSSPLARIHPRLPDRR